MPRSPAAAKKIAQDLLDLHVQHEMSAWNAKAFQKWLKSELLILFEWLQTVPLQTLVTAEQVKATVQRNVIDSELPEVITEMASESANRLFDSEIHNNTTLNEILTASQFEEFVDKLLELREPRQKVINQIIDLPVYRNLISGVLYKAILRYFQESNLLSKNIPGVSSMLKLGKSMVNKAAPKLEDAVGTNIEAFIAKNLDFLVRESKVYMEQSLTDEQLKSSTMELWDSAETVTMADFQEGIDSLDLSELISLGYEFWQTFRQTEYFKGCFELVVDDIFRRYGKQSVGSLLDELLITPDRIMAEADTFAPRLLKTLKSSGQLEGIIRRRLEKFYFAGKTLAELKSFD